MGYRSEVAIRFDLPKEFEYNCDKFIEHIEKEIKCKLSDLFDKIGKGNTLYLYSSWIKWYDDFEDVRAFMDFIYSWEDNFDTGGVHFVRIGENLDDVEEHLFGNVSDYLNIVRTIDFDVELEEFK